MTAQENIHRADLHARVRKSGGSWASIARRAGLSRSAVCLATTEPVPSGNRAIAEFLGTTVDALWPEWFDASGARRASRKTEAINGRDVGHCQNEKSV